MNDKIFNKLFPRVEGHDVLRVYMRNACNRTESELAHEYFSLAYAHATGLLDTQPDSTPEPEVEPLAGVVEVEEFSPESDIDMDNGTDECDSAPEEPYPSEPSEASSGPGTAEGDTDAEGPTP